MLSKSSTQATDLNTLLSGQAMEGDSHHSLATQSEQHQMSTNIVDIAVSVRIGGVSNDIEHQENNTKMAINKASMSTMPTDVVMRIFEALPHATAACLGLTCRGLYACLKEHHPQPIWLGSNNDSDNLGFHCDAYFLFWSGRRIFLWQLLKNWMGTKYKFVDFEVNLFGNRKSMSRFLNRKVYSRLDSFLVKQPSYEDEVFLLWSRYLDWASAGLNPKNSIDCRYHKFESRLPNPYNKGLDWFPEAIEAIKADVTRFEDVREWRIFWSSFHVFRDHKNIFDDFFDECSLDQMSEGLKLLGL